MKMQAFENRDEPISLILEDEENKSSLYSIAEQLKTNIGIIPFVGAGLSIPLGFPGWTKFLILQSERAGIKDKITTRIEAGEYEEAAEDLLKALGERAFQDNFSWNFGDHNFEGKELKGAPLLLTQLARGPVITTNFDHVLEKAFQKAALPFEYLVWGAKADMAIKAFHQNRRFLLKIHGDVEDSTDRILTLSEYKKHYGETDPSKIDYSLSLPRLLKQMLISRPLLFVGCSLNADRTIEILKHVVKDSPGLAHYGIVEKPDDEGEFHKKAYHLSEHGIRPIWYPHGRHELIEHLLEYLIKQIPSQSKPDGKPLKDYTDIYHISGMTVSKKHLSHLVVAPQHYAKKNYIHSPDILINTEDFESGLSPIYFSSISDSITSQLLYEGLRRNRSNARIHQIMSDFPHIKMPFIRNVYIEKNKNVDIGPIDEELKKKGIRALSYCLDKIVSSIYENNSSSEKNRNPIKIYLDNAKDEDSFYRNQDFKASKDFHDLLYTLVILSCNKDIIEVINKKDNADVILSLDYSKNSIEIPIFRFIPVAISNTNIYDLISKYKKETQNLLFLTVGGPEHNKLLELFIALHRWDGGETVFNHSNYFDRKISRKIGNAVSLYNEAFVGGIVAIGTEQSDKVEKNRTDKAVFVISFSIPTNLPWDDNESKENQYIKIVAIIGMSAVYTTLGMAYVSFLENFIVEDDKISLINIPDSVENINGPIEARSLELKQKKFILAYINYLQNKETDLNVSLPGEVCIETLLNPIEKEFYRCLNSVGLEFDGLGQNELHAGLWSLIAKKYLLKKH